LVRELAGAGCCGCGVEVARDEFSQLMLKALLAGVGVDGCKAAERSVGIGVELKMSPKSNDGMADDDEDDEDNDDDDDDAATVAFAAVTLESSSPAASARRLRKSPPS
jgi:hypothetical protein